MFPVGRADKVLNDVYALALGQPVDPRDEVLLFVVAARLRAECDAAPDFLRRPGGDQNPGARLPSHLNTGRPDPTRSGVNQNGLAGLEAAQAKDRFLGREVDFGHGCGLAEAPAVRDRHGHPRVNHGLLGVAAAANQTKDAVARSKALDCGADRLDLTGQLQPQDVRFTGWRRIGADALHGVGTVESRGADPNEQLVWGRRRVGRLAESQDLRSTGLCKGNGFHGWTYFPLKLGLRFSTKAVTPSEKSGDWAEMVMERASLCSCS